VPRRKTSFPISMILSQIQHDKQIPQHPKKGWILDGLGLDKMNYAVL